jgi:hypothetical protein
MNIAQRIACCVVAHHNCIAHTKDGANSHLVEWIGRHRDAADALCREYMPRGSGFDCGTRIDWDRTTADKLVFSTSFHHMNECGYYDGWTEHTVTVRASLVHELDIRVSGRDRNAIKDCIADAFSSALRQDPRS